MQLFEMQGMLAGKCLPGDIKVNESLAEYLLRQLNQRDELVRQVSALQTSQDNIINGLGIKGDGPVSKLVIEYVLGLVAENEFIRGEHEDSLGPYACVDLPATKAAISEIKAQGVDELSSLCFISYNHQHPATEEFLGFCKQFAANLRAGRKG